MAVMEEYTRWYEQRECQRFIIDGKYLRTKNTSIIFKSEITSRIEPVW